MCWKHHYFHVCWFDVNFNFFGNSCTKCIKYEKCLKHSFRKMILIGSRHEILILLWIIKKNCCWKIYVVNTLNRTESSKGMINIYVIPDFIAFSIDYVQVYHLHSTRLCITAHFWLSVVSFFTSNCFEQQCSHKNRLAPCMFLRLSFWTLCKEALKKSVYNKVKQRTKKNNRLKYTKSSKIGR